MTAPNPARDAKPGWRGTDPNGGTWVRRPDECRPSARWLEAATNGDVHYRTQEEAEAAGLVPLVAETQPVLSSAIFAPKPRLTITDLKFEPAVPAPLDPGNPEDLQRARALILAVERSDGFIGSDDVRRAMRRAANILSTNAIVICDRLDREQCEAEREAADRALATEKARAKNPAEWETLPEFDQNTIIDMVMTGIRAADERAERTRQEVSE